MQAILTDRYDVVEYESGMEALEGVQAALPELMLPNISLPEMDGTEVPRRMKEAPRLTSIPVIALTEHAMAGYQERFLGGGFDDYVTKPIIDDTVLSEALKSGRLETACLS